MTDETKTQEIEKKLGIDLATLIKAFDGIWYRTKNGELEFSCHVALTDITETIWVLTPLPPLPDGDLTFFGITLGLRDYGKTWALTREELE